MKKTRVQELQDACRAVGVEVATWSPGDGITRYRFFTLASRRHPNDRCLSYFEADGDFTALGWREAVAYARGRGANIWVIHN